MKTHAIVLDERFSDGREPVLLNWNDSWLQVIATQPGVDGLDKNLDLQSAHFELGGNRNAFLFIRHPSLQSAQIYVEMTPELRSYFAEHPFLRNKLAGELNSFRRQRRYGLITLALILAILMTAFAYRSQIASGLVTLIPFSTEKKIADMVYSRRNVSLEGKKETNEKLSKLVEPLLAANPGLRERLTFHIDSAKEPNAYASIGGHIFINRGLVEILETPEELLGVIAHEAVHANERHVARSVFQGVGLFLVVQTLLGDITGLVAVLADQGTPLLLMKHSRELETEADRFAARALIKSQVDPRGLIKSLRKLDLEAKKVLEGHPGKDVISVLSKVDLWSTHPEMEKRIQDLERFIIQQGEFTTRPIDYDYSDFVSAVRANY